MAGLFAGLSTGSSYGVGVYIGALASNLNLVEWQLDALNTWYIVFALFNPFLGMLLTRIGPSMSLLAGGSLCCFALTCRYLIGMKILAVSSPFIVLITLSVVNYVGFTMADIVVSNTPTLHFPRNRGYALSVVKGFEGLAPGVVTQLYVLVFGDHGDSPAALNCILVWVVVIAVASIGAAIVMPQWPDIYDPERVEATSFLRANFNIVLVIAISFLVASALPSGRLHDVVMVGLAILALSPMLTLFLRRSVDQNRRVPGDTLVLVYESFVSYDLKQMLKLPQCWLLWISFTLMDCAGNIVYTNLGQIAYACKATHITGTLVTVYSSGSALARLLSALPAEALVSRGIPRTVMFGTAALFTLLANALFLLAPHLTSPTGTVALFAASAFGGVAYGIAASQGPLLISEFFGSRHLLVNYGFFATGDAIGFILLADKFPAAVYHAHAVGKTCLGPGCFGLVHVVVCGMCCLVICIIFYLSCRHVELYRTIARMRSRTGGVTPSRSIEPLKEPSTLEDIPSETR